MKTILIVDDELAIRELLADALTDEGYRIVAVENGRRAYEIAKKERPDLVLADMMLPGLSGRELIRRIRETPEIDTLPIIAMSAAVAPDLADVPFVAKPFDVDEVIELVATCVHPDGTPAGEAQRAEVTPPAAADAMASPSVNAPE